MKFEDRYCLPWKLTEVTNLGVSQNLGDMELVTNYSLVKGIELLMACVLCNIG